MSEPATPSTVNRQPSTLLWYAVHTKPREETLAVKSLAREGFETFYPRLKRKKTIRRVRKWVTGPLFPNYIFARFEFNKCHRLVKYANGVSTIVNFGGKPAVVDDTIIQTLRDYCADDTENRDLIIIEASPFQPGERLEIKSGPFMGLQGIFEQEMPDKDRVVILLETIAKGARVQVSREELERIDT